MNRSATKTRDNTTSTKQGIVALSRNYALRHVQVFFYSLGQISRVPMATLMTCMVIGIALALPTGLHVLLNNAQQFSGDWESTATISLFLKKSVTTRQAKKLQAAILNRPEVNDVQYVSREQALNEFQQLSGFGEALDALQSNPLPLVLLIKPALSHTDVNATTALLKELKSLSQTDKAQLDMQWVRRLYAIMAIVERSTQILTAMLALAVLLVVVNTIRLAIQNRRKEIVVMKLIGGTDAFIRRPFLYTGFWYGLFGGIIAWLLVNLAILSISAPIERLTGLYHNEFELNSLSFFATLFLISNSVLLGLFGAWFAVRRHLREIEPQ